MTLLLKVYSYFVLYVVRRGVVVLLPLQFAAIHRRSCWVNAGLSHTTVATEACIEIGRMLMHRRNCSLIVIQCNLVVIMHHIPQQITLSLLSTQFFEVDMLEANYATYRYSIDILTHF